MIKIVVADDEERVCRLIVALGDWNRLGIHVAGTASNGIEALELIEREKADILITDIRMPGCSGLELIERAREAVPAIRIMIISGYANFEYAQKAIKQGVKDYLLKPISRSALNDSLARMADDIRKERKRARVFEDYEEERREELDKIRGMLIQDLLSGMETFKTEETLRDKYHFQFHSGIIQAVVVKRDWSGEYEADAADIIWGKMIQIMTRELEKYCYDMVMLAQENYLYGILNYSGQNSDTVRKGLRSSCNQMLARKDYLGKSMLSMGIGETVNVPEELPHSIVMARRAVSERLIEGSGRLLELSGDSQVLFERRLIDKFIRSFGNALEILDAEEIRRTVSSMYKEAMETSGVHGWEIQELVNRCGDIVILRMDFPDKNALQKTFQENCDNCTTVGALFQYLEKFSMEKINTLIAARREDSVRPVRMAKQYIHNHFQEQITLDEVSRHVGLTTSYFSVLFKKETGIGFAKYLINERIESSKELLRETNLSVAEICRKVGYNDLKHFSRLFEKQVGLKPAAYRKLYG